MVKDKKEAHDWMDAFFLYPERIEITAIAFWPDESPRERFCDVCETYYTADSCPDCDDPRETAREMAGDAACQLPPLPVEVAVPLPVTV